MRQFKKTLAALTAMVVVGAGHADAGSITVGEVGDAFGTATNVDSSFDLSADANIFNSTTISHATILSENNSTTDVDWYEFSGIGGNSLDLDIDFGFRQSAFGPMTGASFDSALSLFDAAGTLLAFSNDSPADSGSIMSRDSFIGTYILPATGMYYAAVSNYRHYPTGVTPLPAHTVPVGALTRPDGAPGGYAVGGDSTTFTGPGAYSVGNYALHISTNGLTAVTPEPTGLAMFGLGVLGLGVVRRRKKTGTPVDEAAIA